MSDRREAAIAHARRVLAANAGLRTESTEVEKTIWGSPAGKKRLADRLVAMLPAHKTYVEPFAGSAAVLFAKGPSEVEVINDADLEIADAYRLIKKLSPEGLAKLKKLPWVGDEQTFKRLIDVEPEDDVERLHRFLYLTHFSYGKMRGKSFSPTVVGVEATTIKRIEKFGPRLAKVKVYGGDYEKVVRKYDGKDTVFFLDPPYPGYNVDVGEGEFDEERFFKLLKSLKGRFLITYGIRGKFPELVKGSDFWTKRIRTRRSIAHMRGVGGSSVLTQLLVANYEPTTKALDDDVVLVLLGFLNAHVSAPTGAHNAAAIAATPHNNVAGTNVQAQLQEIVTDLIATGAAAPGAGLVGVDAIAGAPTAIAAGTLRAALVTLLGGLNGHVNQASGAHAASAIAVADAGANLNAANVEAALAEVLDAFEGDHFKGNEANAGQHRSIHIPPLGGTKALILDSNAAGTAATRLRIYADTDQVWFTFNASWDGTQWVRDASGTYCGGLRLARYFVEFIHEDSFAATFTTWTRTWRLPMSSTVNSAFELTGTVREVGRLGMEWTNSFNGTRTVAGGGGVTFRNRFPAAPSSITLSVNTASGGFSGTPSTGYADRDGFGFFSYQSLGAAATAYWFGSYTAIA